MGAMKNQLIREADANATDNAEEVERLRAIVARQDDLIWLARCFAQGIVYSSTDVAAYHVEAAKELLNAIEDRKD